MLDRIRNRQSAICVASAFCLVSSNFVMAETNVPRLVRTTTRVRVNPSPIHLSKSPLAARQSSITPSMALSSRRESRPADTQQPSDLREFLEPEQSSQLVAASHNSMPGKTRTNRFVELQTDPTTVTARKLSQTPSAAIPSRSRHRKGEIQRNPLVVNSPPKLARFPVEQRPLLLTDDGAHPEEPLVIKPQALPEREIESIDDAVEALSLNDSLPKALTKDVIRNSARSGGFGMLAIDQIGSHLDKPTTEQPSKVKNQSQFASGLELPSSHREAYADSIRQQLRSAPLPQLDALPAKSLPAKSLPAKSLSAESLSAQTLSAESLDGDRLPKLPPPTMESQFAEQLPVEASPEVESALAKLLSKEPNSDMVPNTTSLTDDLSEPVVVGVPGDRPLEVEELIAATRVFSKPDKGKKGHSPQPEIKTAPTAKPTLTERLAGWTKKLGVTSGKNASSRASATNETVDAAPRSRGGILDQIFKRRR